MENSQTASVCDTVSQPVGGLSTASKDFTSLSEVKQWSPSSSFTTGLDVAHIHTQKCSAQLCLRAENVEFHALDLSNLGFWLHMRKKVSIYLIFFFPFFQLITIDIFHLCFVFVKYTELGEYLNCKREFSHFVIYSLCFVIYMLYAMKSDARWNDDFCHSLCKSYIIYHIYKNVFSKNAKVFAVKWTQE